MRRKDTGKMTSNHATDVLMQDREIATDAPGMSNVALPVNINAIIDANMSAPPPPPPMGETVTMQQMFDLMMRDKANSESRIAKLEAALLDKVQAGDGYARGVDNALYRQISDLKDFDRSGANSWDKFVKEFTAKASLIPGLTKAHWLRLLHSHVTGAALNYATSSGIVQDGVLDADLDFDAYVIAMGKGLFGEQLSFVSKLHKLIDVTQTGRLHDPKDYLKECEKIINLFSMGTLPDNVKAALVLYGMDAALMAAISPNIYSCDGFFENYEDVKKSVVATMGVQQMVSENGKRLKLNGASGSTEYKKFHGKPDADGATGFEGPPRGKVNKCVDCGQVGAHYNKGSWKCPMNPKNLSTGKENMVLGKNHEQGKHKEKWHSKKGA
jgi:hypothetical protein